MAQDFRAHQTPNAVPLSMLDTFLRLDFVDRKVRTAFLEKLPKRGLGVFGRQGALVEERLKQTRHHGTHGFKPAVEVDRSDQCLNRVLLSPLLVGGEELPLVVAAVVDVASAAMPRVMTAGQLIAELQQYPPEMLCVGRTDNPEQAGEIKDILRPNLLPLSKRKKSFTDMMDRTNYEEEVYEYDASSGTKYLMITVR